MKNDDSLYVRKSVANNLNDISKDNSKIVLAIAQGWIGNSQKTDWILKHGLRTLLKNGNEQALELFGFNDNINVKVTDLSLSLDQIRIGQQFHFDFSIDNQENRNCFLKIGYMIDYLKSNGSHSGKIFHVAEKKFDAGQKLTFRRSVSMKDLTTRKHYPGEHRLHVLINGKKYASTSFDVLP